MPSLGLKPVNPSVPKPPKVNIPGLAKPVKAPKTPARNALFGPKKSKPTIQSTPVKVPTY